MEMFRTIGETAPNSGGAAFRGLPRGPIPASVRGGRVSRDSDRRSAECAMADRRGDRIPVADGRRLQRETWPDDHHGPGRILLREWRDVLRVQRTRSDRSMNTWSAKCNF